MLKWNQAYKRSFQHKCSHMVVFDHLKIDSLHKPFFSSPLFHSVQGVLKGNVCWFVLFLFIYLLKKTLSIHHSWTFWYKKLYSLPCNIAWKPLNIAQELEYSNLNIFLIWFIIQCSDVIYIYQYMVGASKIYLYWWVLKVLFWLGN